MKEKLIALRADMETKSKKLEALLAIGDSRTPEQVAELKSLDTECEGIKASILEAQGLIDMEAKAAERRTWLNTPVNAPVIPEASKDETKTGGSPVYVLPAHGPVTSFTGRDDHERAIKALRFGMFARAACGIESAKAWCAKNTLEIKASYGESSDAAGGALVPQEFLSDLIRLVDTYGVFRANARRQPMSRDLMVVPRRSSGITAYWVAESGSITSSRSAYDKVELQAKKLAALAVQSSELAEDAAIDMGNTIMDDIALAFAQAEDDSGFNGDGSGTYGRIIGLNGQFKKTIADASGTWTTDAHRLYNPSIINASGNLWSEFVAADMTNLKGAVRAYAFKMPGQVAFYCSQAFWASVIERLVLAAGGTTAGEMLNGSPTPRFLGYPVIWTEVMAQTEGASVISCYFGNLRAAAMFADRREMTLARSDQFKFDTDELAIRGTERLDINVHDVGTANSSAASRVKGPIAALCCLNA